jgi:hypothetical protein
MGELGGKNITNTLTDNAIPSTGQTNAQYEEKISKSEHNDKHTTYDAHHTNSEPNMRHGMDAILAAGGLLIDTPE